MFIWVISFIPLTVRPTTMSSCRDDVEGGELFGEVRLQYHWDIKNSGERGRMENTHTHTTGLNVDFLVLTLWPLFPWSWARLPLRLWSLGGFPAFLAHMVFLTLFHQAVDSRIAKANSSQPGLLCSFLRAGSSWWLCGEILPLCLSLVLYWWQLWLQSPGNASVKSLHF